MFFNLKKKLVDNKTFPKMTQFKKKNFYPQIKTSSIFFITIENMITLNSKVMDVQFKNIVVTVGW